MATVAVRREPSVTSTPCRSKWLAMIPGITHPMTVNSTERGKRAGSISLPDHGQDPSHQDEEHEPSPSEQDQPPAYEKVDQESEEGRHQGPNDPLGLGNEEDQVAGNDDSPGIDPGQADDRQGNQEPDEGKLKSHGVHPPFASVRPAPVQSQTIFPKPKRRDSGPVPGSSDHGPPGSVTPSEVRQDILRPADGMSLTLLPWGVVA